MNIVHRFTFHISFELVDSDDSDNSYHTDNDNNNNNNNNNSTVYSDDEDDDDCTVYTEGEVSSVIKSTFFRTVLYIIFSFINCRIIQETKA